MSDNPTSGQIPTHRSESSPAPQIAGCRIRCSPFIRAFTQPLTAPYLNYHRPCHFPVETTDSKGRTRKSYPFENVTTPYLKLKSLDGAQRYLRPGVTFEQLDSVAVALDDLAAARLVNAARDQLFRDIERRETKAA